MGLVERLNELESMRQSGQISDAEYAMLVASATNKFGDESEPARSSHGEDVIKIPPTGIKSMNSALNIKMVGVGLICVLVGAFLVFGKNSSNRDPAVSSTLGSTTSESDTKQTSVFDGSSKVNREDSAKACREERSFREGMILLMMSRNSRNEFFYIQYEDAGSLRNAKTWISEEMNAITEHREGVTEIDRPELSNEKNALILLLTQLEESQLYLLGAQSWSEFSRLATQYQLALRGFYDSEFATALRKLCKG